MLKFGRMTTPHPIFWLKTLWKNDYLFMDPRRLAGGQGPVFLAIIKRFWDPLSTRYNWVLKPLSTRYNGILKFFPYCNEILTPFRHQIWYFWVKFCFRLIRVFFEKQKTFRGEYNLLLYLVKTLLSVGHCSMLLPNTICQACRNVAIISQFSKLFHWTFHTDHFLWGDMVSLLKCWYLINLGNFTCLTTKIPSLDRYELLLESHMLQIIHCRFLLQ